MSVVQNNIGSAESGIRIEAFVFSPLSNEN
jgi:hypothetical protein